MLFHPLALAIALATFPSFADAKGKILNILSWQSSTENVKVDAPAAVKDTIMKDDDASHRDERQLPKETINTEYCFTSKEALQIVVNAYIDQGCSANSYCAVRQKYGDIGTWCTTGVTDMSYLFQDIAFNDDISGWDVSSVTDMSYMFDSLLATGAGWDASSFNQPLNSWDVSMVTNMDSMFRYANSFNQPLDEWDVSSVTDMTWMFYYAYGFNQNLCAWGQFPSFPYENCWWIFEASGCDYQDDPTRAVNGPFCASDCLTSAYI